MIHKYYLKWVGDGREGGLSSLFDWWWERRDACKAGILNPQEAGGEGPTPAVEGEGAQECVELSITSRFLPFTIYLLKKASSLQHCVAL